MYCRDCRVVGFTMLILHIMWTVRRLVCVLGDIMLTIHLHVVCTHVFVIYFWRSCVDCTYIFVYMCLVGLLEFWLIIHV